MVCRGEALRAGQSGRYGVGDGRTGRYAERANGADERLRSEAGEPARLFAAWFAEAKRSEPVNPDAMALATVGPDGMPNARMVLMKGSDLKPVSRPGFLPHGLPRRSAPSRSIRTLWRWRRSDRTVCRTREWC